MRELRKRDFKRGVEEALIEEMCQACRQWDVEIPVKEIASCFEKAITSASKTATARFAVRTLTFPYSDCKLEKSLVFLKLANLGLEIDRDQEMLRKIKGRSNADFPE